MSFASRFLTHLLHPLMSLVDAHHRDLLSVSLDSYAKSLRERTALADAERREANIYRARYEQVRVPIAPLALPSACPLVLLAFLPLWRNNKRVDVAPNRATSPSSRIPLISGL